MASRPRRPSPDAVDVFLLKLIAFRGQLTPREQQMLDALAVSAFVPPSAAGERGYSALRHGEVRPDDPRAPWLAAYEQLGPDA